MLSNGHLTSSVKTIRVSNSAGAATDPQDTAVVDMQGYNAARFIWLLGDVTSTSVLQAEVFRNSASSTSSPAPVEITETAAFTADASNADSKVLIVDVLMPGDRYIFSRLKRGVANAVIDGCIVELYRSRELPQAAHSSVLAQKTAFEGGK